MDLINAFTKGISELDRPRREKNMQLMDAVASGLGKVGDYIKNENLYSSFQRDLAPIYEKEMKRYLETGSPIGATTPEEDKLRNQYLMMLSADVSEGVRTAKKAADVAGEVVEELGEPRSVYRAVDSKGAGSALGQGKYFAFDKGNVARYGDEIEEFVLDPKAKMLDLSDPNKLDEFTEQAILDNKELFKKGKTLEEKVGAVLTKAAKDAGYDGIVADDANFGSVVFDDSLLKPVKGVAQPPVSDIKLYHGTASGNIFDKFEIKNDRVGVGSNALHQGDAVYLTDSRDAAEYFSTMANDNARLRNQNLSLAERNGGKQLPGEVFEVSLEKGAKVKQLTSRPNLEQVNKLRSQGYDAISFPEEALKMVEGHPISQIKSNTFVVFDPNKAHISPKPPKAR